MAADILVLLHIEQPSASNNLCLDIKILVVVDVCFLSVKLTRPTECEVTQNTISTPRLSTSPQKKKTTY